MYDLCITSSLAPGFTSHLGVPLVVFVHKENWKENLRTYLLSCNVNVY